MKNIHKKRWAKAESFLHKSFRKDSANAVTAYLASVYFFSSDNPAFQPDSAYHQTLRSMELFRRSSLKQREKMQRFPLDSGILVNLREKIDSAVFEQTKVRNTEDAYVEFLKNHLLASQRNQAVALRDEVAFLNAVQQNKYEAFFTFLEKYPEAAQASEARKKYERLLYENKTKDKRLSSYEKFLREYPETPFRKEIEQHIFELFTLSGEAEKYSSFIQLYPESPQTKKARNILFHILLEKDDVTNSEILSDSLIKIRQLQESFLVPFLKNGKFGLMDKQGKEIIPPSLDQLFDNYKCGNITEDVIMLPDRLLGRDGHVFYKGDVKELIDIGTGFLKIQSDTCMVVLHKSGFVADRCAADAKVLGNRFLALLRSDQWNIYALNGRKLLTEGWEEIDLHGNILILKKENQWHLLLLKDLLDFSAAQKTGQSAPFDDIKILPQGLLWVKAGEFQGILNQSLEDIIPFDKHELIPSFFGFMGKSQEGYSLYDWHGKQSSSFEKIIQHHPWVVVKKNNLWYLFDAELHEFQSKGYDSIRFEGPFPMGISDDTVTVHFSDKNLLQYVQPVSSYFIPGKDSTSFLIIETEGKKDLYNLKGKKLFTVSYDLLQNAGKDLFIVSKKEKKGLIDSKGKVILPVDYDAIGGVTNGVVSLLKAMKFGLFEIESQKLIKPQYDKNLIPYNRELISAYQQGFYGFIDWTNKPHGDFEFEDIQYWNDTTALVRKNQLWNLYEMATQEAVESGIKKIKMIHDTPEEKLAIIQTVNNYGVLSSKRGDVIPLTFTDLVNVGSADDPLYFTEKHVSEAAIFVVIYYDKNGKLIRREIYEEAEDYEKIYCPDN